MSNKKSDGVREAVFAIFLIPSLLVVFGVRASLTILVSSAGALIFASIVVVIVEHMLERFALRKEQREQRRALCAVPLRIALRSTNPALQAAALSAVQRLGFTSAALEEVYQNYTFEQLLESAEPEDDSGTTLESD